MTARKALQAILCVMHNSLSEIHSEGKYSIVLEPFALALALAYPPGLEFALAQAKPLPWCEMFPSTGVGPHPGLEFGETPCLP